MTQGGTPVPVYVTNPSGGGGGGGDATAANQIEEIARLNSILTQLAAILTQLAAGVPVAGAVEVTNDAGTPLPVNGTLTANLGTIAGVATQTTLAALLAKIIGAPSTEAKQDTVITALGTLLTTAAFQARINTLGQKTMANSMPVALASDQSAVALDAATLAALETINAAQNGTWTVQPGNTPNTTPWLSSPLATSIDATLTRPADTNAYAANDEISNSTSAPAVNTITNAARASSGTIRLISARCIDSANQATKPQLLVFVFDTTTTPNNDNAAFAPADSVLNTCVGILPFNVWYPGDDTSGAGGNAVSPYLGPVLSIKTVGSANLFFRVKVLNAYTPVSAEALVFRFDFIQD